MVSFVLGGKGANEMCNELSSSKRKSNREAVVLALSKSCGKCYQLICTDTEKATRSNRLEGENACSECSGGGKQIKAEGGSKGGRQSVKGDNQSGSVQWTGIASQALLPGETPMCTLSSGQDLLSRRFCEWRHELRGAFQADRLAADHFQPRSPDAATWPVAPEYRSRRRWCAGWVGRRRGV